MREFFDIFIYPIVIMAICLVATDHSCVAGGYNILSRSKLHLNSITCKYCSISSYNLQEEHIFINFN